MDSLELSPSFRALAEELDNPQIRPSDTQMRLIERELDLIAGRSTTGNYRCSQQKGYAIILPFDTIMINFLIK